MNFVDRLVRDRLRARDPVHAIRVAGAVGYHAVETGVIHAARQPLLAQARDAHSAIGGAARGLKQRQQVLDPVVGPQRRGDQAGQQQVTLAERLDHPILRHHTP